jgi:hypothetical protein
MRVDKEVVRQQGTAAFDHRRRRPGTQRWLAVAYRTGGRMGMRRGSIHEEELGRMELTEVDNGGDILCKIQRRGGGGSPVTGVEHEVIGGGSGRRTTW